MNNISRFLLHLTQVYSEQDTIYVKVASSDTYDLLSILLPVLGTLLGVLVGFYLKYWQENKKDKENRLSKFVDELILYSKGEDNYIGLINRYNNLSKSDKKYFKEVLRIDKLDPGEKLDIINEMILYYE